MIEFRGFTNVGTRKCNADAFEAISIGNGAYAFIVVDGCGDHEEAQCASQLFSVLLLENLLPIDFDQPYEKIQYDVQEQIVKSKDQVFHKFSKKCKWAFALCIHHEKYLMQAYIGDCKIYKIKDGAIVESTVIHSIQNHLDQNNDIDEVLTRVMKYANQKSIQFVSSSPLIAGEVLVICSDGYWKVVDDAAIPKIGTLEHAAEVFAQYHSQFVDNATVVVLVA